MTSCPNVSLGGISSYIVFPQEQRRRTYCTNPLERLNRDVKRRANVGDESRRERRYFSQASMKKLLESERLSSAGAMALPLVPVH